MFGRKPYFGTPGINPDAPYPGKPMDDEEGFSSGIAGAVKPKKRGIGGFLQDVLAASVIGGPQFLAMRYQQRDDERNAAAKEAAYLRQKEDEAAKDAREFEQSKQLVDYSAERRSPTAMQQNYEFLKATNPQLAEQYLGAQANPYQWITADNGDGTKSIIPIPRGGTGGGNIPQPPTGGGQPVTPKPSGGSVAAALKTNPGAIRDGKFARSQPGYTGSSGGFATFASPDHGARAQQSLLTNSYINKGFNTVDSIVERYAPGNENSAASRNNYKAYVARRLGIGTGDKVSAAQAATLAQAMREFETGKTVKGGAKPKAQSKRLSNGTMAYFVNGKWYDNPDRR